jgi:hypothetical protein
MPFIRIILLLQGNHSSLANQHQKHLFGNPKVSNTSSFSKEIRALWDDWNCLGPPTAMPWQFKQRSDSARELVCVFLLAYISIIEGILSKQNFHGTAV